MVTKILNSLESFESRSIHIVSRGGSHAWYPFQATHHEIYKKLEAPTYFMLQKKRIKEFGHQKQSRLLIEEEELLVDFFPKETGPHDVIHPMIMVRCLVDYWAGMECTAWLEDIVDYEKTIKHISANAKPENIIALKLYSRESLTSSDKIDCCVNAVIASHPKNRIIELINPNTVDEHRDFKTVRDRGDKFIAKNLTTNLVDQFNQISRAKLFLGTYGGFTYLAQYLGIPVLAWEEDSKLNRSQHLFTSEYFIKPLSKTSINLVNTANSHSIFHD